MSSLMRAARCLERKAEALAERERPLKKTHLLFRDIYREPVFYQASMDAGAGWESIEDFKAASEWHERDELIIITLVHSDGDGHALPY